MSDKRPKVNFDLPWPVDQVAPMRLTSKIYPIVAFEKMTAQGALDKIWLYPDDSDGVDVQASLTTIDLRAILQSYEMEAEGVDSQATLLSLELKQVLQQYEMTEEGVDSQATLLTIELKTALVANETEPEGVDTQATLTRIVLS